jgi:hypothetical protein
MPYSLGKNIIMEYSHIQKLRYGARHMTMGKKKKRKRTYAEVRNKNVCFQVREYDECCAGLHVQSAEHSP